MPKETTLDWLGFVRYSCAHRPLACYVGLLTSSPLALLRLQRRYVEAETHQMCLDCGGVGKAGFNRFPQEAFRAFSVT